MQISVFFGEGGQTTRKIRARNVRVLSHPVMSTLPSYGLEPARLLCPWGSPGKNTGVGSHSLLQAISLTQGLNLDLLHCRQILYGLSHEGRLRARRKPQDHLLFYPIVLVQSLSHVWLFATPWTACSMRFPCPSLSPGACSNLCPLSQWCHTTISSSVPPLLLLPSIFLSIRVFSSESVLRIRWPKYWSFSSSISPSNEHSGLISFRIAWFDPFAI